MDEGGFIIDYHSPYGTSLEETNRQLLQAEEILRATPEVEGYSRRTGARLALAIAEPNTGDFLVKLRPDRQRHTQDVDRGAARRVPRRHTRHRMGIPGNSHRPHRRSHLVAAADRSEGLSPPIASC